MGMKDVPPPGHKPIEGCVTNPTNVSKHSPIEGAATNSTERGNEKVEGGVTSPQA